MSYWKRTKEKLEQMPNGCETTTMVYKKVAASGVNMLSVIKPSFYLGQLSVLASDYMRYVDRFLESDDRDWGEYLKFTLYIREISKRLVVNVQTLNGPLTELITAIEEILEGERIEDEDYGEEKEPEALEEPDNLDMMNEDGDEDDSGADEEHEGELKILREELQADYETFKEDLRVKIRSAQVPPRIVNDLSKVIADVYLECIQLLRELERLSRYPEGDLSTLLSILVDIRYGLSTEMKRHLYEDIVVEDQFQFNPGLVTWTAHFLASFSEKINEEWKVDETTG